MALKYEEILSNIRAGRFEPIYFLCGEEPFFLDRIAEAVEEGALTEEEKAFNQTVVYGNEVTMATVTDTARRFPMMAERQVVIVREAQNIKDFDSLLPYIEHFQPTTILVLLYKNKKPDKRKGVFKKLNTAKQVVFFESAKLYENKVPDWIIGYCREKKYLISPRVAAILTDSLGNDLSKVAHELDKLMLLLPAGGEIKEKLVEDHTGISKEFNNFELIAAIRSMNYLAAHRIVNYFGDNPKSNPLVVTLPVLFKFFRDLLTFHYQKKSTPNMQEMARLLGINPYFIKDYEEGARRYSAGKCARVISLIREYDLKSKGVGNAGTPDGELLKELVFKIMH